MESSGRISLDHPPFGLSPNSGTETMERIFTALRPAATGEAFLLVMDALSSRFPPPYPIETRPGSEGIAAAGGTDTSRTARWHRRWGEDRARSPKAWRIPHPSPP